MKSKITILVTSVMMFSMTSNVFANNYMNSEANIEISAQENENKVTVFEISDKESNEEIDSEIKNTLSKLNNSRSRANYVSKTVYEGTETLSGYAGNQVSGGYRLLAQEVLYSLMIMEGQG